MFLQHNTFQMVLMTNGSTSYTVFLYNSMNWGNSAGIGFTNGSSFYTLAGGEGVSTLSDVAFLPTASNVAVNGVYIFRTDSSTYNVLYIISTLHWNSIRSKQWQLS